MSAGSDRIAVLGLSMGGEEAIGAAGADGRIAAVVAEGATGRTDADKAWFADLYGFRGRIQLGLEWLQYTLTDLFWSGTNSDGEPVANGVYFCHITAEGRTKTVTETVKIAVLRGSSD